MNPLVFIALLPLIQGLNFISYDASTDGFLEAARGWNSFALQSNPDAVGGFTYNTDSVLKQCTTMRETLGNAGFEYCSLDSGWSVGDHGDEHGRPYNDTNSIDIARLTRELAPLGVKVGVYLLPGAFCKDMSKTIEGTNITIADTMSGNNNGFARCDFDFSMDSNGKFTRAGVQEWHNSVVRFYAQSGISFIKLDFITPGSPEAGNSSNLPPDNSGSVRAFHNAIQTELPSRSMRLHISWKLERNATYLPIWNANTDAMRTDQDINQSGAKTLVQWQKVQRAIENYRQWYLAATAGLIDAGLALRVRPDLDSLLNGNDKSISGISDVKRQSVMTHWIGAGAPLITGSDMRNLDHVGMNLYTNQEALDVANFTSYYPMQPVNPGGGNSPAQVQAWIAGVEMSAQCKSVVVLANYGPDEGEGGFGTAMSGVQKMSVEFKHFGLGGTWNVRDVWKATDLGLTIHGPKHGWNTCQMYGGNVSTMVIS
ncbi:family 27 glycoside hydrolase [Pseudovirgaria hyperparasitica]|uniref:alpha-galactosidase n=1 Tax=Pseudovirgaria hyperparasitica TaxID=470096 RepID=A0A6A6VX43_9PEZI|nr:family 27 glycoside hydrolase [Pseudovirgaria hyperparasitica]KAF2754210.1 family 27 glycoside hydrolase [Pseudovirgaria hyperparasitica]